MTDRPVNGDHPDYNPSPENPEKDGKKPKDDPGSAPESGDKEPEWWQAAFTKAVLT